MKVRTTIENWNPYSLAIEHENGTLEYRGFFADVLEQLTDVMNITVEYRKLEHASFKKLKRLRFWLFDCVSIMCTTFNMFPALNNEAKDVLYWVIS